MSSKARVLHIDVLRAAAIIGVMITHSLALFLGPGSINAIWNYLHFVVVAFVGCSGYVSWGSLNKNGSLLSWYKKRFFRLYIPYAVYCFSYVLLAKFLPSFITGHGIVYSPSFFLSSILLTGGMDVGWLTILFLQLTLLTPVFLWLLNNAKRYFLSLFLIGLFSFITTFFRISSEYSRLIAWLPWSFVFLLGAGLAKLEKEQANTNNIVILVATAGAILWILLRSILISQGALLTFTLHKYPPDLFYISYGIGISGVALWITKLLHGKLTRAVSWITFFSAHAYGMFFLQLIVLDALTTSFKNITLTETTCASILLTIAGTWVWGKISLHNFSYRIR